MIQFKVFIGTIFEITRDFNLWSAGLPKGVNLNMSPLVRLAGDPADDGNWMKEVTYVLPDRSALAVPKIVGP